MVWYSHHCKNFPVCCDPHCEVKKQHMHIKKQQLELDMKQQTDSKSGKGYVKAVYCHLAYLTSMQSTS